ncbi:MAG: NAD(P)/FAD-dependent oxidoreductase [Chloroflexota bacterium]
MTHVIVIGGGPAGVTAALRARELGAEVSLVERGMLGGTCTNDGCVPTRALAKAARLVRDAEQFSHYGLISDPPRIDFQAVLARTQQVVYQVQEKKQLLAHLQEVQIQTFAEVGNAVFSGSHTLHLENGQDLEGDKIIICAGGSPRKLTFPGSEHTITHSEIWGLTSLPKSVIIVGGGATGCQLASIFAAFGAHVTLMDVAPRLLITEDEAVADIMTDVLKSRNIDVITGIEGLQRIDLRNEQRQLSYGIGGETRTVTALAVVMAVGWPGNLDSLHLESANIERSGNYIQTNDFLQTSAPHIYAAGDITGRMMLVQSAGHQARIAVENAVLGNTQQVDQRLIPHGGFTDPEYGSVGLTEASARKSHDVLVATVPYADLDRAVIDDHLVGFCKLIIDRDTQQVIGAHVVGEQAVEVIQMVTAGMAGQLRIGQFADLELAYPTFAAIVGVCARQLAREIGEVPVVPQWRSLIRPRASEWERRERDS